MCALVLNSDTNAQRTRLPLAITDEILEIEARLERAGLTASALCREAGIARSTWQRWKSGETEPTMGSWRSIQASLDRVLPDTTRGAA